MKCRHCKQPFTKILPMQKACSPTCAIALVQAAREKKERKETRERRAKLKTRSQWMKEAQAEVNRYVRLRDENQPCISCGRLHGGQWHAGHYLSVGARPELRFDETNIWRQCAPCNTYLSGNLVLYRAGLIQRIGLEAVERLEGPHPGRKYTVNDLKAIRDLYRQKTKELCNSREKDHALPETMD